MSTSLKTSKRFFTFFIALTLLTAGLYVPTVSRAPQAHAQFIVEAGPVTATILAANTTANTSDVFIKKVLDGLAWTVAKIAIQSMTKSIVNWINSGFNGSPAFATDLNKTLRGVADAAADMFFDSLKYQAGIDVKTPFGDQVARALRNDYYKSSANGIHRNYNLYQSSSNPEAFLNGQFEKGGFNAWFATTLNSDNNPIGALFKTKEELQNTVANVQSNQLHELDWGHGFLSWRGSCAQKSTTLNSDAVNALKGESAAVDTSQKDNCLSYNIETPGSVIENQLNITATSPLRQLELADSINEIVSALMGQLVNHILGEGGLSGASNYSSGGGSSYIDQATSPTEYDSVTASLAQGFTQEIQNQRTQVTKFQKAWQTIGTKATEAQTACSGVGAGNNSITVTTADGTESTMTLNDRILQVSTIATTALGRATTALTSLDSLSTRIGGASGTTAAILTNEYQSFLSGTTLPNATEVTYAEIQSKVNEDETASATNTLYDEMLQAVKTCNPFADNKVL